MLFSDIRFKLYDKCMHICDSVDLPLFVVVEALQGLCCVMFHIYDLK